MTHDDLLSKFDVTYRGANYAIARCPCGENHKHDDANGSLYIKLLPNSRANMTCLSGCERSAVMNAVGLTYADMGGKGNISSIDGNLFIWAKNSAIEKNGFKHEGIRITAIYDFDDTEGNYCYSKIKIEGTDADGNRKKTFRQVVINWANGNYETFVPSHAKAKAPLFHLPSVVEAVKAGVTVCIPEGEKDCLTLEKHGYIATTTGSATSWEDSCSAFFKDAKIVILPDNDGPGEKYADDVSKALLKVAESVKVVKTSDAPGGDVSDYFAEGHKIEDLGQLILSAEALNPHAFKDFEPFRARPNLPSFPVECLPEALSEYVVGLAKQVQVPVDMVAVQALGVLSIICQGRVVYHVHETFTEEGTNLYTIVIAPTGERKSSTLSKVRKPLDDCISEWNVEHRAEIAKSAARITKAAADISKIERMMQENRKNKGKSSESFNFDDELDPEEEGKSLVDKLAEAKQQLEDEKENAVKPLHLMVDDVTPESLAIELHENDERMGILSDEGGLFQILAGLYTGGKEPNIDLFLKAYSGQPHRQSRAGRGHVDLESPFLTIHLSVQPIVVREAVDNNKFMERGLMPRFLFSWPVSLIGERLSDRAVPVSDKAQKAYADLIKYVFDCFYCNTGSDMGAIRSSLEAARCFKDFADKIEEKLISEYEPIQGFANRIAGNTARIAGLLHIVQELEKAPFRPVSLQTMQAAIKIGEYFLEHLWAVVFGYMPPNSVIDAEYILNRLKDKERETGEPIREISTRDLQRLCRKWSAKEDGMREALSELEEHGYIRIDSQKGKSGRPSKTVFINPEYIETQKQ